MLKVGDRVRVLEVGNIETQNKNGEVYKITGIKPERRMVYI